MKSTRNQSLLEDSKVFFTDIIKTKSKITLIEKIISEDQVLAEVSNIFFLFRTWKYLLIMVMIMNSSPPMTKLQTLLISLGIIQVSLWWRTRKKKDGSFSFAPTTYDGVLKKVKTLDTAKDFLQSEIPTKILKLNSDYFAEYFYENINQCISKSIFPSDLKLADVTPVYKKKCKNCKGN